MYKGIIIFKMNGMGRTKTRIECTSLDTTTVELQCSNTDGSFTTAVLNSFLSPLEKKLIAADLGQFMVSFLFILKMVNYVYSLESPR